MNRFLIFLGQNFLATVIMVTSFIADLFTLAKIAQKGEGKNTGPYFAAVLSLVCLISIGYLTIQYSTVQANSGSSFDNGASMVFGGSSSGSDSSNVSGASGTQTEGEHFNPDDEKSSDIDSGATLSGNSNTETEGNTQIKNGYDNAGSTKSDDSAPSSNIDDFTQEKEQNNSKFAKITGPYNSSSFTLDTQVAAGLMTINDSVELFGILQNTQEEVIVNLIDNYTNRIVDTKCANLGSTITFSGIPNGTYYYAINCAGYKETLSRNAFTLERNTTLPEDSLAWYAVIEPNNNEYSIPFTIQVQNVHGEILKNVSVEIGAINTKNLYTDRYSAYLMKTDEQGNLTSWENIDGVDYYHLVSFQLAIGYYFEISTDGMFGKVDAPGNPSVCIVKNP